MARTIAEIKDSMTSAFIADATIQEKYQLESKDTFASKFNVISIESILFYVFAVAVWAVEKLIDQHKTEIQDLIETETPHTLTWYQNKAKTFRYGQALITDTDQYDDTGLTDADIEAMQVIKACAVVETTDGLTIKTASENSNGVLQALTEQQLTAFTAYINEIRDAGVHCTCISSAHDNLILTISLRIDATVLDANGCRLDDGTNAIEEAIETYLRSLPFNGELILASLTDALQAVDGVKIPHIESCYVERMGIGGYGEQETVAITDIPYSGYYELTDLTINIIS